MAISFRSTALIWIFFSLLPFSGFQNLYSQRFSVGEPETVFSNSQREARGIGWLDVGIYGLKDGQTWKWFSSDPNPNVNGQVYGIGPKEDPLEGLEVKGIQIVGVPDIRKNKFYPGEGTWLSNVYLDPETRHIIGFVHCEYWPHETERKKYCRMGLSISKDGGRTFQWCGYIVSPHLPYQTWKEYWSADQSTNVGLANYIIKDGWFYLYYRDTEDHQDEVLDGMAVVRAKISKVLSAAEVFTAYPWKKFFNGEWSEEGLGGRFTPLNIEPLGRMHGDAAYNSYLDKYVLVTLHGGKYRKDMSTGSIQIAFSDDGMHWSDWQTIVSDNHFHEYPSIVSKGDDNEVTGKSFWVYYKYIPGETIPKHSANSQYERVLITLE
jgi:hypothetical protein